METLISQADLDEMLNQVKIGDPNPTPAALRPSAYCKVGWTIQYSSSITFDVSCTRCHGHSGQHVAEGDTSTGVLSIKREG